MADRVGEWVGDLLVGWLVMDGAGVPLIRQNWETGFGFRPESRFQGDDDERFRIPLPETVRLSLREHDFLIARATARI